MMVAVAVTAGALGAVEGLRRRGEAFQRRAAMFAQKVGAEIMAEQSYRINRRSNRPDSPFYYDFRTAAAYEQLVNHYDALRSKYEHAAARPWWFVAPDPLEPDWPKDVIRR